MERVLCREVVTFSEGPSLEVPLYSSIIIILMLKLIIMIYPIGKYLDILAISCDSFNEATNRDIGRHQGNIQHLNCLKNIREWCHMYKVAFKLNTVVNTHNWEENMTEEIEELNPVRWKVRTWVVTGQTKVEWNLHITDIFRPGILSFI